MIYKINESDETTEKIAKNETHSKHFVISTTCLNEMRFNLNTKKKSPLV